MQNQFDRITIIYNPSSTGDAPTIAKRLFKYFTKNRITEEITLSPTEYAGNAVLLAEDAGKSSKRPLIVSVSGDGGFHEVINGVMASGNTKAVCAVEGAGNANDHWRAVHSSMPLENRINNKPKAISLLKLSMTHGESTLIRYAHSYVGFGISAQVAQKLNKYELNPLMEKGLVFKELLNIRSVRIQMNGQIRRIDSLLAANINEMAKQLKLDTKLRTNSAKFRLIINDHRGALPLIGRMLNASVKPEEEGVLSSSIEFKLLNTAWVQCDGEPIKAGKNTLITITGIPRGISTI